MERATSGQVLWKGDDGRVIGVCLGADFTEEHECGIKRLCQYMHIDSDKKGADARTVQNGEHLGSSGTMRVGKKFVAYTFQAPSRYDSEGEVLTGKAFDKTVDDGKLHRLYPSYDYTQLGEAIREEFPCHP